MAKPITVIVCGDRNSSYTFESKIRRELEALPKGSTVVHGGCKGIDVTCGKIAENLGLKVKVYPADWSKYGLAAGPIRNKKMLNETNPSIILAFHPNINESKGTKHMMKIAKEKGCKVILFD